MDMKRRNTPHAMIVDTRDSEVTMESMFAAAATPIMMNATTCVKETQLSDVENEREKVEEKFNHV